MVMMILVSHGDSDPSYTCCMTLLHMVTGTLHGTMTLVTHGDSDPSYTWLHGPLHDITKMNL